MISYPKLCSVMTVPEEMTPQVAQGYLDRAREFVERQTDHYFGPPEDTVEVVVGNGSRMLALRERVTGTMGEVLEQCHPGATQTVLHESDSDGGDFDVRHTPKMSVLARRGGHCWKLGYEYLVSYQHGYEVDAGPKDIEQLVIDLVALRFSRLGREGLAGETIGGYSWTAPAIHAFEDGDLRAVPGATATIRAWRRLRYV